MASAGSASHAAWWCSKADCQPPGDRGNKTLRNIKSAWIKEQHVRVAKGKVVEYQVNMLVTFVLED
ncbi:MAG: dodecin domain-containing protein [Gammaproteobacteria bacterium PRO9]|nr:dodecin domain-containing protein [Gammaproteobacteria bacterium PRO9]